MANATNSTAAPIPEFVPSTIILGTFAKGYVENANVQIAPWTMGTLADLFLMGIIAAQTANYFGFRDVDGTKSRFTWLVILLLIMCCLKTAQNITIVWDVTVTNFANPDVAMMLVAVNWWHYTTSLSTAIIATFVQGFFTYRYWMLTRRWYVCVVMILGMITSLVAASFVIAYLPLLLHDLIKKWSLVHFVAAIIVDTLITVCTAWHLQSKKTAIQSTAQLIDRLIRTTWQSALPPTICVIVNAAVLESRPLEITHIAFNMILPKLYAISLLYTLNLRNDMRNERMTSHERSTGSKTHPTGVGKHSFVPGTNNYPRGQSVGNVERGVSFIGKGRGLSFNNGQAGRVGGIHVETQITRDGGGSSGNTMELRSFPGDDVKSMPPPNSDFEREVWEQETKYNAR